MESAKQTTSDRRFRFKVSPSQDGWTWAAVDARSGAVYAQGHAADRAVAAAYVVAAIARAMCPTPLPRETRRAA